MWGLENQESSGILFWDFPGVERPVKRFLVLESSGNLLNSGNKVFFQTVEENKGDKSKRTIALGTIV